MKQVYEVGRKLDKKTETHPVCRKFIESYFYEFETKFEIKNSILSIFNRIL